MALPSRRLSRQYHPCRPSDHRYLDLRQVKVHKDEAVAVIGISLFLIMPLTREGFCLNYTLLWQNFHLSGTGSTSHQLEGSIWEEKAGQFSVGIYIWRTQNIGANARHRRGLSASIPLVPLSSPQVRVPLL